MDVFSETPLEMAYDRGMNIQFVGKSSVASLCNNNNNVHTCEVDGEVLKNTVSLKKSIKQVKSLFSLS